MNPNRLLLWSASLNLLLAASTGYLLSEHFHRLPSPPESTFRSSDAPVSFAQTSVLKKSGTISAPGEPAHEAQDALPAGAEGDLVSPRVVQQRPPAGQPRTSPVTANSSQPSPADLTFSSAPAAALSPASISQSPASSVPGNVGGNAIFARPAGTAPYTLNSRVDAPTYPMVLTEPDPAIPLTKQQAQVWEQMQQNFSDAVGGPNRNPSDPDYAASWNQAKDLSDQMFRAKFGFQAWLQQSTVASRRGRNP